MCIPRLVQTPDSLAGVTGLNSTLTTFSFSSFILECFRSSKMISQLGRTQWLACVRTPLVQSSVSKESGGGAERTAILEVNSLFCCCFWTPTVYTAQADLELLGLLSNQSSCPSLLNNWNFPQGTQLVEPFIA